MKTSRPFCVTDATQSRKSVPKSASVAEYAYATALEALFGWLYLKGRYERINELFEVICQGFDAK